jgi:hypothetical protein
LPPPPFWPSSSLRISLLLKRASARPLEEGSYFLDHLVRSRRPLSSSYFTFVLLYSSHGLLFACSFFMLMGRPGMLF